MTPEKLIALSDDDLRREVTRALEPGPWEHRCLCWTLGQDGAWKGKDPCVKCEQAGVTLMGCPVPDAAVGSWADLAERTLRPLLDYSEHWPALLTAAYVICPEGFCSKYRCGSREWRIDAWATVTRSDPRKRICIGLLALQEDK